MRIVVSALLSQFNTSVYHVNVPDDNDSDGPKFSSRPDNARRPATSALLFKGASLGPSQPRKR